MDYNENKLVKIEGKGEKGYTIYAAYLSVIEDGYNLTVDEASNYIGCSYTYFITRLIDKILHIRINTPARKLIYQYANLYGELADEIVPLIKKRILLNRSDFFAYMKKNICIEQQYKVFTLDDFDISVLDEIQKCLDIYNSKHGIKGFVKTKEDLINDIIFVKSEKNTPAKYNLYNLPEDFEMPEKLLSLKEIKLHWGIKHDMTVYRMLDANGARKYILFDGAFIRYDARDFEHKPNTVSFWPEDIFRIDYKSYLILNKKHGDALKEIQMQLLKTATKLAKAYTNS